jgi:hypothetical protein
MKRYNLAGDVDHFVGADPCSDLSTNKLPNCPNRLASNFRENRVLTHSG